MTGVEISTRQVLSPSFGIIIVLTMIFISIVSGIYPSVLFAKKAPIVLMKSSFEGWGSKSTLRKLFIILQYSISVILMIMVFFIIYQLQFVKNKDLNIQQKNKLVINIDNTDYDNNPWPLKNHLLKLPQVKSVSVSHVVPWIWRGASFYKTENENNSSILWPYYCDYDFFKTYGIKVIKGRVFNELNSTDIDTCILNEKAVDILGLQEPLDAILKTRVSPENAPEAFRKLKVIGVIKDFNNQSLHEEIRPMIIQLMRPGVYPNYVSVDLRPGNTDKAISEIEKVFSNLIKGQPFEYFLLEDFFNNFYLSEDKFFNIFMIGSITAILLSCFGLFGLAAFILQQRTKEVGIRKVLGATSLSITLLLTKRFILWLIIANVIAWPIAFIYVNDWLSNFVYRVNMDIRLFILAGIISVFAAFSAIITHTIKVATSNPVKLLRYE
jgi:putative ABC transport system permease protein